MAKEEITEGRLAKNANQVFPEEMSTQEINELSYFNPGFAETVRQVREEAQRKKQVQRMTGKLVDFGIPEDEMPSFENAEDVFNFLLDGSTQIYQKVTSLEEQLGYEKGINKRLQGLQDQAKEAGKKKDKAEKKFVKALEMQVKDLFNRIGLIEDETERRNSVDTYKMVFKNYLQNQHKGQGYEISEDLTGLGIKFTDSTVALLFADKLGEWQKEQLDEATRKYADLQVQYLALKKELRSKGLSDTFIDGELQKEVALAHKNRFDEIRVKDELVAGGDRALKHLQTIKEMARVRLEMDKLVPRYTGLQGLERVEDRIAYVGNVAEKIAVENQRHRDIIETNQEQFEQFIEQVATIQKEAGDLREKNAGLNKNILTYAATYFKGFRVLGEFLEKHNIRHKFGYAKTNGRDPMEYLEIARIEFGKMASVIEHLVKRNSELKTENRDLVKEQKMIGEARNAAENSNAMIERLRKELEIAQDPEQEKLRKALGRKIQGVQKGFLTYLVGHGLDQSQYPELPKKVENVKFEELIADHYLGILSDAAALVRAELSESVRKMSDSVVDIEAQKTELAQKYGCETVDELTQKVKEMDRYVALLKFNKKKEFQKLRKQKGFKFKTLDVVLNRLHGLKQGFKYAGMEYLKSDGIQKELQAIYKSVPESHKEINEKVLGDYEAVENIVNQSKEAKEAKSRLVGAASELDETRNSLDKAKGLVSSIKSSITRYTKIEDANQKILDSPKYQEYQKKFNMLRKVGQILGVEINSPEDLVNALNQEKDFYQKHLDLAQETRQRLGL